MLFNLLFVKYHLMLGRHICLTLSLLAYLVFLVPILCKVLIGFGQVFMVTCASPLRPSADSWQCTSEQLGPDFMHLLCLSRACI